MTGPAYSTFAPPVGVEDHGNGAAAAGGIESLPRFGLISAAGSSGRLWVSYVTAAASGPIGRLMVATGDTAAATVTLARLALFTVGADGGSLTKVAQTASDVTIGAATFSVYDRALSTAGGWPAQYVITRGRRYALGFLMLAGTPASLQGAFTLDAAEPPVPSRVIAGQTDIATTYAVGALSTYFNCAYLRGLPPAS